MAEMTDEAPLNYLGLPNFEIIQTAEMCRVGLMLIYYHMGISLSPNPKEKKKFPLQNLAASFSEGVDRMRDISGVPQTREEELEEALTELEAENERLRTLVTAP